MNATAYAIETAPIPEATAHPNAGRGRPILYPFALLKKGQCFKVADGNHRSLLSGAQYHGKKLARTFSVRSLADGVIGVWRVK